MFSIQHSGHLFLWRCHQDAPSYPSVGGHGRFVSPHSFPPFFQGSELLTHVAKGSVCSTRCLWCVCCGGVVFSGQDLHHPYFLCQLRPSTVQALLVLGSPPPPASLPLSVSISVSTGPFVMLYRFPTSAQVCR